MKDVKDWRERIYECLLCSAARRTEAGYTPGWTFVPTANASRLRVLVHAAHFHHVRHEHLSRAELIGSGRGPVETYRLPDGTPFMKSMTRSTYSGECWRVGAWDSGIRKKFGETEPPRRLSPPGCEAELH